MSTLQLCSLANRNPPQSGPSMKAAKSKQTHAIYKKQQEAHKGDKNLSGTVEDY